MTVLTGDALVEARAKAQEEIRQLRLRKPYLDGDSIDLILKSARSHYAWQDKEVSEEVLEAIYEIAANGPTSINCCPARFVFVRTEEGKERLLKSLKPGNVEKVLKAPVTAIVAYDVEFWKKLPFLFPHKDLRQNFEGKEQYSEKTAFLNGTLQGAYWMIAARALGLDVGAMSGFSNEVVDEEFFKNTSLRSNFLCNVGYADESAIFQKLPRFSFGEVCSYR